MFLTILAKYPSKCRHCQGFIPIGTPVVWEKGVKGVAHVTCPATPEPPKTRITSGADFELVRTYLSRLVTPNEFQASLLKQLPRGLTEKQLAAVLRDVKPAAAPTTAPAEPVKRAPLPCARALPMGRYAIQFEGDMALIRLYRGTRNPNYVKLVRQYVDQRGNIIERGIQFADYAAWMDRIVKAGMQDAAIRYGRYVGRCSKCGARLTDRVSIELGIGPVCGRRLFGDAFGARITAARAKLLAEGIDPNERIQEEAAA